MTFHGKRLHVSLYFTKYNLCPGTVFEKGPKYKCQCEFSLPVNWKLPIICWNSGVGSPFSFCKIRHLFLPYRLLIMSEMEADSLKKYFTIYRYSRIWTSGSTTWLQIQFRSRKAHKIRSWEIIGWGGGGGGEGGWGIVPMFIVHYQHIFMKIVGFSLVGLSVYYDLTPQGKCTILFSRRSSSVKGCRGENRSRSRIPEHKFLPSNP